VRSMAVERLRCAGEAVGWWDCAMSMGAMYRARLTLGVMRAGKCHRILENHVRADGRCPDCGTAVAGVGMDGVIRHAEIRCEEDELARLWALYPRDE